MLWTYDLNPEMQCVHSEATQPPLQAVQMQPPAAAWACFISSRAA